MTKASTYKYIAKEKPEFCIVTLVFYSVEFLPTNDLIAVIMTFTAVIYILLHFP